MTRPELARPLLQNLNRDLEIKTTGWHCHPVCFYILNSSGGLSDTGKGTKRGGDIGISEKQIVSNGLVLYIHMIVSPSLLILILLAKGHKMQ